MPLHKMLHLHTLVCNYILQQNCSALNPKLFQVLWKNLNWPEHSQSKAASTGQQTATPVVKKWWKNASNLMVCKFQQSKPFQNKKNQFFIRSQTNRMTAPPHPPKLLELENVLCYHEQRSSLSLNILDLDPKWFTWQFLVGVHVHKERWVRSY